MMWVAGVVGKVHRAEVSFIFRRLFAWLVVVAIIAPSLPSVGCIIHRIASSVVIIRLLILCTIAVSSSLSFLISYAFTYFFVAISIHFILLALAMSI